MLYKTIIVLFAVAVASLALPSGASARGGGHGGGGDFMEAAVSAEVDFAAAVSDFTGRTGIPSVMAVTMMTM